MIPKIVHYCWLSKDPIPKELQFYMQTWKEKLFDYEFILWNFERFDKKTSVWVEEAFNSKKYAFAADYIRLYALYKYGGIYLDMDVEVLKPFDDFLSLSTMLCFEKSEDNRLEVATLGVEKNSNWIKECLSYYENRHFINDDGSMNTTVLPIIIRDSLERNGYALHKVHSVSDALKWQNKNIPVFSSDFFSPKSYKTKKIETSSNTYSIHHFSGTWIPWEQIVERRIWQMLRIKSHPLITWHIDKWLSKIGIKR
ncbi:MAG: glycosyl transferase [Bacteroidales bacterium]|nr:glycosyl transferase [Bacteroidales bacterium]